MYQTILVPLDGSTRAESILPHVENQALQFKSKVIFLQVWTVHEAIISHANDYILDYTQKKEEISEYLASIQAGFQKNTDFRNKYNRHLNITFFDLVI